MALNLRLGPTYSVWCLSGLVVGRASYGASGQAAGPPSATVKDVI